MRLTLLAVLSMLCVGSAHAEEWRDQAVSTIKSGNEATVVDAMFSQPLSLWVSVRDDGSNRDGFAQYLCLETSMAGRPDGERVIVSVWDAVAMAQDEMKKLGTATCG